MAEQALKSVRSPRPHADQWVEGASPRPLFASALVHLEPCSCMSPCSSRSLLAQVARATFAYNHGARSARRLAAAWLRLERPLRAVCILSRCI